MSLESLEKNVEKELMERDAIEKFYRGHRTLFNARATGKRELWDKGFQIVTDAEKDLKTLGLQEKEVYEKMLKDFEDEGFDTKNPPGKNY